MIVVRFEQGTRRLTAFRCPLESPDHLHECVTAAFRHFYKEYPGLTLLDGVCVLFNKVD
jgi:hypothetical protein